MSQLKNPKDAPIEGLFLAKFLKNGEIDIVVLKRYKTSNSYMGVAGNIFEFDLGEMIGWCDLPEEIMD